MLEYAGKALVHTHERVTGRLCFALDGHITADTGGTKIVLWDGKCELTERFLRFAVGMVLPECVAHAAKETASGMGIPVMTVATIPDIFIKDERHLIAVLDTSIAKLYVDPDIETVSTLLCEKRKDENAELPKLIMCSDSIRHVPSGFEGLITKMLDGGEESTYDYLCELADRNTGARIVALLCGNGGAEKITALVRAAYRAGVWGRFSILFCGVRLPEEISVCTEALHRAYRELDAAGREFNGFIPKGIAIETPLMLMCNDSLSAFDFFCIDTDRLSALFCGDAEKERCIPYIAKYVEAFAQQCTDKTVAVMSEKEPPPELINRIKEIGIKSEIYIKGKNI